MQRALSEPQKKVVAARQGWRCSDCKELLPAAYQVDHTVPLWAAGEDSIDNCTAMCPNCHAKKTQLESIARHAKAKAEAVTYDNRVDVFVSPTMVKCTLCNRTRRASLGHNVCPAIETPHLHAHALRNRLSQFAYVSKFATRSRFPTPLPLPAWPHLPAQPDPP